MAKRKPKPATAGERVVTAWNDHHIGIDDVRDDPESRDLASRIDAAIRRAVRKERERCIRAVLYEREQDAVLYEREQDHAAFDRVVNMDRLLCIMKDEL